MSTHPRTAVCMLALLSLLVMPMAPMMCQLCISGGCPMPKEAGMAATDHLAGDHLTGPVLRAGGSLGIAEPPCHESAAPATPESPRPERSRSDEDCCSLTSTPAPRTSSELVLASSTASVAPPIPAVTFPTGLASSPRSLPRENPDPDPPPLFALHRSLLL